MQGCVVVQRIIALDMEGVVTPEIWVAVAEHTGLSELTLTTRDEPDYQKLMRHRISVLSEHGIGLSLIRQVISTLRPLEGAREFLDGLRQRYQVVILSDTFEQFAAHLMKELGRPHLLCHELTLDADRVVEFEARIDDAKRTWVTTCVLSATPTMIWACCSRLMQAACLERRPGFLRNILSLVVLRPTMN